MARQNGDPRVSGRQSYTLLTGVAASLLYVAADAAGAILWPDYSPAAQGVSELMSAGAPSRPLVLAVMSLRSPLQLVFAFAVWRSARESRALRWSAILLVIETLIGEVT